jgi:DNA-binding MarR family transcriptional regulator
MATRATRDPATHQSIVLVDHLARVMRRQAEEALAPLQIRPRHLVALTLLRDRGAATQQQFGGALHLDPSNVVGLLNELESAGLATRRRDPDDRRRHIVEISAAGAAALEDGEHALAGVEEGLLGDLSDAERATLHDLLLRAAGGQVPGGACLGEPPDIATDC